MMKMLPGTKCPPKLPIALAVLRRFYEGNRRYFDGEGEGKKEREREREEKAIFVLLLQLFLILLQPFWTEKTRITAIGKLSQRCRAARRANKNSVEQNDDVEEHAVQ